MQNFNSFQEFYPFYLSEHRHPISRRLHFAGTGILLLVLISAIGTANYRALWFLPVVGYGFAWVGHFGFEKNRPATFKHPLYSMRGDFVMFFELLTGKLKFDEGSST